MSLYYDHAGIQIYHGDCREIITTLPKVDLVLTDPPYGTGWVRGGKGAGEFQAKHEKPDWDVWDASWMDSVTTAKWAIFCPLSRVVDVHIDRATTLYYRKTNPRPGGPTREAVVVAPIPWSMDKWEYSAYNGDCPFHPCQKPMELLSWLLLGITGVGDLILDPFMGSGTTLVAAKQLGRRAIGIEICEAYCEIAAKRLSQEVFEFTAPEPVAVQDELFGGQP